MPKKYPYQEFAENSNIPPRMTKPSSKAPPTGYPEFAVRRESFDRYFDKPLPRSTFHDLVGKGVVVPLKGLKGFYTLNDALRRLGLREVPSLPDVSRRSGEELVRLAFTLIDPDIFPVPSWLGREDPLDAQDVDVALLIAEKHRDNVEGRQTVQEKLAYLAGVLDCEEMIAHGLPAAAPVK